MVLILLPLVEQTTHLHYTDNTLYLVWRIGKIYYIDDRGECDVYVQYQNIQFVSTRASKKLNMPVVSGNVSLYNETDGEAILPTPTIGGVGVLADYRNKIIIAPKTGQVLILIGETNGHLGQSALLEEVLKLELGEPPKIDLDKELQTGQLLLHLNDLKLLQSAHDLSDGGLATAAAEMALMGKIGIRLSPGTLGWLFGEDQGRYLVSCWQKQVRKVLNCAQKMSVPAVQVGLVEGEYFYIGDKSIKLSELSVLYESGLSSIFE